MKKQELIIVKSHPCLKWLSESGIKSHQVPSAIVKELSKLKTMEAARDFVESAGLSVQKETGRKARLSDAVSVAPPQDVKEINQKTVKYVAPQIVLPKTECNEVPFGTVLMNCLLPETKDISDAEHIFREYQDIVIKFCKRLKTLPFICITGFKKEEPRHDLDFRGFRFFFSPRTDEFFEIMVDILKKFQSAFAVSKSETAGAQQKMQAVKKLQKAKFCEVAGKKIGSSILDDIKFQASDTILVDLR
jgi:hypothetical protein